MMELLKVENLSKSYGKKEILKNINFTIKEGRIVGLLGKNGVGKTTIIKLINDLLTKDTGTITINNQEIGIESKKQISYLPERTYLDKTMKVKQVIKFFEEFYEDFDSEKAHKLLKDLNLDENEKIAKIVKIQQKNLIIILAMRLFLRN